MFDYRIAYGCWLNDSRLQPITQEDWPSIRIDRQTLDSLDHTLGFLSGCGYNYFDVFGLITNHAWQHDVAATVDETRRAQIRQVIDLVHRHGLKLIYGLGVYSWGFDQIIAHDPQVRGTSAQAMCASSAASWHMMRQVIDYLVANYELDGFHLEAADQGRCHCPRCAAFATDIDYYNAINIRTADYIRSRWPQKTLLVNTSGYLAWGDQFSADQLAKVADLGQHIDVFIDVGSHGAFVPEGARAAFARQMPASVGTANGFWIYPPQRWARDRWLIPHVYHNHRHLQQLYRDGGRSAELYLSPLNNPGAEITILANGLLMLNPERTVEDILAEAVQRLYDPSGPAQAQRIAGIFRQAEELFFACWTPQRNRALPEAYSDGVEHLFQWSPTQPQQAVPGEFFLEKLFGIGPGFPCYLTVHFDAQGRLRYREGMQQLLAQAHQVAQQGGNAQRLSAIVRCLENTIADLAQAAAVFG